MSEFLVNILCWCIFGVFFIFCIWFFINILKLIEYIMADYTQELINKIHDLIKRKITKNKDLNL